MYSYVPIHTREGGTLLHPDTMTLLYCYIHMCMVWHPSGYPMDIIRQQKQSNFYFPPPSVCIITSFYDHIRAPEAMLLQFRTHRLWVVSKYFELVQSR